MDPWKVWTLCCAVAALFGVLGFALGWSLCSGTAKFRQPRHWNVDDRRTDR